MTTFYRHIVVDSWNLSRQNFFLWPLAFFASFIGIAGTFQIFFDMSGDTASFAIGKWYEQTDFLTSIFIGWSQSFDQIAWSQLTLNELPILIFFFFLLIIVLTLAIVTTSSEGGLIYGLSQLQAKKKTSFKQCFRRGVEKFWQLFGINLIYRLLYLIILAIVILPLLYLTITSPASGRLVVAAVIYLLIVPFIIILDLVTRYSLLYIMVYKMTVTDAIRNAWLLFITNWIISIETALLILASLFIIFLLVTALLLPLLLLLFIMFGIFISFSAAVLQIFIITSLITFITIIVLFITLFTTLQMSIWVGVFRKITTGQHYSKAHRLLRNLPWLHKHII